MFETVIIWIPFHAIQKFQYTFNTDYYEFQRTWSYFTCQKNRLKKLGKVYLGIDSAFYSTEVIDIMQKLLLQFSRWCYPRNQS